MNLSLIGGLEKVCFFNPVNGDRVLVHKISSEATETPEEKVTSDTPTGVVSGGKGFDYHLGFFDYTPAGDAQFTVWEQDKTPICAVLLYSNGVRYFLDPVPINGYIDSALMNSEDGVSPFSVHMMIRYSDPDVYLGNNLIRTALKRNNANKTERNFTANYVPKRLSSGTGNFRLSYASQGLGMAGGGTPTIRIPFPFPGVSFKYGVNTEGGPSTFTVSSQLFNGTVVNSETEDTGSSEYEFTIGTGAFWLAITLPNDDLSGIYARLRGTGNIQT